MEFIKNVLTGELTGEIEIILDSSNIHSYARGRKIRTYIAIDSKEFE